jgi:Fe-S-cluster-containing hydrogenase component 2
MVAHACMHCVDAVCLIGCPTGAIHRELETGEVQIDDSTCIGCGTCARSCPYDNIVMVEIADQAGRRLVDSDTGTAIRRATKCDLCTDQWGGPACQRACPNDALVRLDMSDREGLAAWLRR